MELKIKFGERVRHLRNLKGISQETLADLAEIDRTYMSGIERGKRNVSITTINKISVALGMDMDQLLKGM